MTVFRRMSKKLTALLLLGALLCLLAGCVPAPPDLVRGEPADSESTAIPDPEREIELVVSGVSFTVKLADTDAAQSLAAQLPMQLYLSDEGGYAKCGYLTDSLPENGFLLGLVQPGSLLLRGDRELVLVYESAETNDVFTEIGEISSLTKLSLLIGRGGIWVTLLPVG